MSLNIGLDLCDDYITAYDCESKSLLSVPAVICREKKDDLWYIGESAYRMALSGRGVLTDKLLSLLKKGGTSTIARKPYTAEQLLSRMLAAIFWQLLGGRNPGEITALAIAVHEFCSGEIESILAAAEASGIDRSRIRIISHSDAFVYYTLSQSKDLYANMTALFDLSDEMLSFYRMKTVRGISRNSVVVEGTDLEESFRLGILKTESGAALGDRIMTDAARRCLNGDVYSSVILTGRGFERTDWARSFLELACRKRRVIYEKGLFAIGAGLYASANADAAGSPYLVFSDTSAAADLYLKVMIGERETRLALVRAGQPWYDAGSYVELLPHDQDYVEIHVEPVDKFSVKKTVRISLEDLAKRPDRCTRISLELKFTGADTVEATVRDLGFGDIFPAKDTVIQESFSLAD